MKNVFKTVLMAAGFSALLCSCQTSSVTCNISLPESKAVASKVTSVENDDKEGTSKIVGGGNVYIINVKSEVSKPIKVANPTVDTKANVSGNQTAVNSPSSTFSKVAIPAAGAGIGGAIGGVPGAVVGAAGAATTVELVKEGTETAKETFSVDSPVVK